MKRLFSYAILPVLLILIVLNVPTALAGVTERVNVSSDGTQAQEYSYNSNEVISTDGRFVAFVSSSSNLVPGDTNDNSDIFVYDRLTNKTERVSIASDGSQGNDTSDSPSISADGRFVAFQSNASNLVPGDTNGYCDIFVYDRETNTTELISVASDGTQGNHTNNNPSISADGRFVVFNSYASNLVSGDTNRLYDIFVHDRTTHKTERVNVASDGSQSNAYSENPVISADGNFVAFISIATNLVSGDTNNVSDIFVHDRITHKTERVSVSSSGSQGNADCSLTSISANGQFVAFWSDANNLVSGDTNNKSDVFVHDRTTHKTERVSVSSNGSQANNYSRCLGRSISGDGRFVTFHSAATNLVSGDTNNNFDIFVYDRTTNKTERVSVASNGSQGNGDSVGGVISDDGQYVAFLSSATNLVTGDTNNAYDIFVHALGEGTGEPVDVTFTSLTGYVVKGWNLVSIPAPPVDGTPANVFKSIDLGNASLQLWDNASQTGGGFLIYGVNWNGPIKPGDCYWFVESASKTISYTGTANTSETKKITIPAHSVYPYWIMIGHPYDKKISCENISFTTTWDTTSESGTSGSGTTTVTETKVWADAVAAGWIEPAATGWDASSQSYFYAGLVSNPAVSRAYLEPWYGYWLLVKTDKQITINIPTSPLVQ